MPFGLYRGGVPSLCVEKKKRKKGAPRDASDGAVEGVWLDAARGRDGAYVSRSKRIRARPCRVATRARRDVRLSAMRSRDVKNGGGVFFSPSRDNKK